jgi:hypothetical protein
MWIILSFVSKSSKKNWQIFTKNLVHAHCVISGIMDSQTQKHRTQFCCTFCWRYICRSSPSAYLPLVSWASIRKVSPWLHVLFSQNPFNTFLSHYLVLRYYYYLWRIFGCSNSLQFALWNISPMNHLRPIVLGSIDGKIANCKTICY